MHACVRLGSPSKVRFQRNAIYSIWEAVGNRCTYRHTTLIGCFCVYADNEVEHVVHTLGKRTSALEGGCAATALCITLPDRWATVAKHTAR